MVERTSSKGLRNDCIINLAFFSLSVLSVVNWMKIKKKFHYSFCSKCLIEFLIASYK